MILDEITLHNFGLYLGRQTLRLTPEPGKPVILIGGLNISKRRGFHDCVTNRQIAGGVIGSSAITTP